MFGWAQKVREIAGLSDGVPIRDGLTYAQDQARVLDMLCLCGELDGLKPGESYSSYLRRIIDHGIGLERAATKAIDILDRNLWRQTEKCEDAIAILRKAVAIYQQQVDASK